MLSLLYRAEVSADPATGDVNFSAGRSPSSAGQAPASIDKQRPGAEVLTKRAHAERAYAELSADGTQVSSAQLAAAAGLSSSHARALVAEFQARPAVAGQHNGHLLNSRTSAAIDSEQKR